jgi:hypothetical protein
MRLRFLLAFVVPFSPTPEPPMPFVFSLPSAIGLTSRVPPSRTLLAKHLAVHLIPTWRGFLLSVFAMTSTAFAFSDHPSSRSAPINKTINATITQSINRLL